MGQKLLDGFLDLSFYDKLKRIERNLIEIQRLIDSIEQNQMHNRNAAYFTRSFIDQKGLKKLNLRIGRFLRSPLHKTRPGRPQEYPDSPEEATRYRSYRQHGMSIRQIARREKMSPDTIFRKLKRYQIE